MRFETPLCCFTKMYHNDQWQILYKCHEWVGTSPLDQIFVYGNYIDEVLLFMWHIGDDYITRYYAQDHLYSPVALLDEDGDMLIRYEYDAYGKMTRLEPDDFSVWSRGYTWGNDYGFTGREVDAFDGGDLNIMYYRARFYDPYTGRFLQRDPLGVRPDMKYLKISPRMHYFQGMNLYQYVGSKPIISADALGLYGYDVHMRTTATLAAFAGFCSPNKVGTYAQQPDEDERSAMTAYAAYNAAKCIYVNLLHRGGTTKDIMEAAEKLCEAAKQLKEASRWHFPRDGKRVDHGSSAARREMNKGLATCDLKTFGEGIHPFQDSWSHEGGPSLGDVGHDSDKWYLPKCLGALDGGMDDPKRRPDYARDMALETYRAMTNFLKKCTCYRCRDPLDTRAKSYIKEKFKDEPKKPRQIICAP